MDPSQIKPGYKVQVRRDLGEGEQLYKAEVISGDSPFFFVHFIGYNTRLDAVVHHEDMDLKTVEIRKVKKKAMHKRNIRNLYLNGYRTEPWYYSPFPSCFADKNLYICNFCLLYLGYDRYLEHNCKRVRPPGREVWRSTKGGACSSCKRQGIDTSREEFKDFVCQYNTCKFGVMHSFFECDGDDFKNYCRNLSLISKLFLDHKTLFYDVNAFTYYLLCRLESDGFVVVGYFSKEKISLLNYNLACILVFPFEQRKGYGKMLIDFSYILSNRDKKIQTCEKPFSDLGLLGYLSYWKDAITNFLVNKLPTIRDVGEIEKPLITSESELQTGLTSEKDMPSIGQISIKEIAEHTGIKREDVTHTLLHFKMVRYTKNDMLVFFVPSNYDGKPGIDIKGMNPNASGRYCYSQYRIE